MERLNSILQQYLNPPMKNKLEKEQGNIIFREGDKVMQTKNNYQLSWEIRTKLGLCVEQGTGVFNGDMGVIREINDFAETMTVEFEEGRRSNIPISCWRNWSLPMRSPYINRRGANIRQS